jgi:hypothetical protein
LAPEAEEGNREESGVEAEVEGGTVQIRALNVRLVKKKVGVPSSGGGECRDGVEDASAPEV